MGWRCREMAWICENERGLGTRRSNTSLPLNASGSSTALNPKHALLHDFANCRAYSEMVMRWTCTGVRGRSRGPVGVLLMAVTTSIPEVTFPKTGCLDAPGEK